MYDPSDLGGRTVGAETLEREIEIDQTIGSLWPRFSAEQQDAARSLSGVARAKPHLIDKLFRSKIEHVRSSIIQALSYNPTPESRVALIRCLRFKSWELRHEAVYGLQGDRHPDSKAALKKFCER